MAEFRTEIKFNGTAAEYKELMQLLHYYAEEMAEQHKLKKNCWYLIGPIKETPVFGNTTEKTISVSGPYGVWNDMGRVDLFERIADAVPGSSFTGSISGWDPGGEVSIGAELKDGLLYLSFSYDEFEDDWEVIHQMKKPKDAFGDGEEEPLYTEDIVYDPRTHEYQDFA